MPLYGMRLHCAAWKLQGRFDFFAVQFSRYQSKSIRIEKRGYPPNVVYLVNSGIDVVGIVQIGPQRAGTLTQDDKPKVK